MNKLPLLLLLFCFQFCEAQTPAWQWTRKVGGTDGDGLNGVYVPAQPIAQDRDGNIYIATSFASATLTIGNATFINNGNFSSTDIVIIKYDSLGNQLWAQAAGGIYYDEVAGIVIDSNNNVYLAGVFTGPSISFDTVTIVSAGSSGGAFLVKFSSFGAILWGTSVGKSNADRFDAIAIDSSGYVYTGGTFQSSIISIGSTTLTNNSPGVAESFIVKYSPAGVPIWATAFQGAHMDDVRCMDVDVNGNLCIAGYFSGSTFNIGGQILTNTNSGASITNEAFLAQFTSGGSLNWATSFGSMASEVPMSLRCGANGDIYLSGNFNGTALPIGSSILAGNGQGMTPFLAKFDAQGTAQWAVAPSGAPNQFDAGYGLALDANGNVHQAGGYTSPAISFGATTLNRVGQQDGFIATYSPFGVLMDVLHTSAPANDTFTGSGITISPSGKLYLTGAFTDSLKLTAPAIPSAGAWDIFLAMYGPSCSTVPAQPASITGADTVCAGNMAIYTAAPVPDAASYLWSLPTGWTGSSSSPILTAIANVPGTGTLSVTAINNCGTGMAQTKTITVEPLPTPVIAQSGLSLNTASGQGTYQWYRNDTLIAGATTNVYAVSQNGSYYLIVTNGAGCSDTSNMINVTTVGINDVARATSFIRYSGNRQFTISGIHSFPASLTVYNVYGALIYTTTVTSGAQLNIQLPATLASGTYLFSLRQRDTSIHQLVFVE